MIDTSEVSCAIPMVKKIKAMNIYKTQIRPDKRDGSSLTALARIRGNEIGLDYAEAYHVHRLFL